MRLLSLWQRWRLGNLPFAKREPIWALKMIYFHHLHIAIIRKPMVHTTDEAGDQASNREKIPAGNGYTQDVPFAFNASLSLPINVTSSFSPSINLFQSPALSLLSILLLFLSRSVSPSEYEETCIIYGLVVCWEATAMEEKKKSNFLLHKYMMR